MTAARNRVALVDDDADLRAATAQLLALAGHDVMPLGSAQAALAAIDTDFAGVVVTDVRMPGMSGVELFHALRARDADLPVILITGHGDIDMAVGLLKSGAWDFLPKPFAPDALLAAVARGATARTLVIENRLLRAAALDHAGDELIGQSAAIRRIRAEIPVIARTDLDVVIEGATGTGKQMLARLLHRASPRARHRFVTLDCAAPGDAATMFARHGLVAQAHRGTLYLANLDRADETLQHRLSRFAEIRATIGDARDADPVDARIVAAIDPARRSMVLPSLYHRLASAPVRLPALAERAEDIPLLAAHFAGLAAQRHGRPLPALADMAHRLAERDWTGNVRELEMAAERLVLGLDDAAPPVASDAPLPERVNAFERAAIGEAVTRARGDVSRAAEMLGIPRETFYYRAKRLGLDLKRLRARGRGETP